MISVRVRTTQRGDEWPSVRVRTTQRGYEWLANAYEWANEAMNYRSYVYDAKTKICLVNKTTITPTYNQLSG